MANQNLSQFTEKLFVADADHTFIWDTAASISKRVSRNSWLSGTTADFHLGLADAASPVAQTISVQSVVAGTTNTAGAAFTIDGSQGTGTGAGGALIFRTAAAGSSGTAQNALGTAVTIVSDGRTVPYNWINLDGFNKGIELYGSINDALTRNAGSSRRVVLTGGTLTLNSGFTLGWTSFSGSGNDGANPGQMDTILLRDGAANTLALRNGANAQTFNVYGTYTSGTSYERLTLSAPSAANAIIGTNKGSGGGTARGLDLQTDGAARMTITTAGNVGIGTTAPTRVLTVVGNVTGTNVCLIQNTNSAGYAELAFDNDTPFAGNIGCFAFGYGGTATADSNNAYFFNRRAGAIFFGTTAAERMRITSAGNVGIGTTSPTSKLQVTGGDVEIETVTSGIIMKAAGTATRYRITLNAGGTDLVFTAI